MTDQTLLILPRTERTEVRLTLSEYRQRRTVDLRLFFRNEAGDWLPSRKGCAIQPRELADLLAALESARQEVAP